jgi:acetyltransferase-like isoleucine patch superfamily enzyme
MINTFIKFFRKEEIKIGKISDRDLLNIILNRLINFSRGLIKINIIKFKRGYYFISKNVKIKGFYKIKFGRTTSLGTNVLISSIGSEGFHFGNNFSLGKNSTIEGGSSVKSSSNTLTVKNNVGISQNFFLAVRGKVNIGNDVIIGPYVKIFSENHSFNISKNIPFRLQNEVQLSTLIGNNVWIGSGVIILAGVKIEDNVVIAAGSVVTKSLKKNCMYGGIPAIKIKNLN